MEPWGEMTMIVAIVVIESTLTLKNWQKAEGRRTLFGPCH